MKKLLKSALSLILAITFIFSSAYAGLSEIDFGSLFVVKASAAEDNGTTGQCTWTVYSTEVLYIRGNGDMADYSETNLPPWPKSITQVVIEDGVTSIGNCAFYDYFIYEISIPDSVQEIGYNAFESCGDLEEVILPDGLKRINSKTFYDCDSLRSVVIPETVTFIGPAAFDGCFGLGSIVIPDSVTYIGEGAFQNSSLYSISLPDTDISIDRYAFENTSYANNKNNWDDNGLLYIGNHLILSYSNTKECVVRDGTRTIASYAFLSENITNVSLPEGLTVIGDSAFKNCSYLETVTLPNSLVKIDDYAFENCSNLVDIRLPDSLTSLGVYVFNKCSKINSIIIPEAVTYIPSGTFNGCSGLTYVIIPDSVTSINGAAFRDCTAITEITLPEGVTFIGSSAFYGCTNLENIFIPDRVTTIGSSAFYGCTSLKNITISDGVMTINSNTFFGCTSLSDVTIPDTVTTISYKAFSGCSSLTSISIPNGVTIIDDYAFEACSALKSVMIPDSVTEIGDQAFRWCSSLSSVSIGASVRIIGSYAFGECPNLTSISVPQTVEYIYTNALGCYDATIPYDGFVIYGVYGTVAEEYAKTKGITFIGFDPSHTHYSDEWIVENAASCTNDGLRRRVCDECGASYESELLPAHGHQLNGNNKCNICGKQFSRPLRDYTIYVYDVETGNPINDTKVNLDGVVRKTDSNGAAKFQLENDEAMKLTIVASSYPQYRMDAYLPTANGVDYIYLTSTDSDIYSAKCNDYNVIYGSTQINIMAPISASVTVRGRAKANILRYELIQDSVVIATSTDGNFNIRNSKFKVGKDVYVRMYTDGTEGHNVFERKLNIKVVKYGFDIATDIEGLLPFANGLKFTFPSDAPGFSGFELELPNPFNKNDKVNIIYDNNRIVVMYGSEVDYADTSDMDGLSSKQVLKKLANNWAKETKNKKKREVHGYVAIIIEFDDQGNRRIYGEVNVGFNLSLSKGQTFFVGVIPVYGEIGLSLGGDLTITNIRFDAQKVRLYYGYEAALNGKLTLYAGLGCVVASVGVYGELKLKVVLNSDYKYDFKQLTLSGEMGLYAKIKLLFFKELVYTLPLWEGDLVNVPGVLADSSAKLYSLDSYTTDPRAYLENRTPWLNAAVMSGDSTNVLLQDSTYTAMNPKIVTCGDTTMMLFMDDDGSEGFNYQHLYYSIYDNVSGGWSEPQRLDDNNRCDVEFDVYSDDSSIYVAYTELDPIVDITQDNDIVSSAEVAVVKYNFSEGRFMDYTALTDNDTYDSLPQINGTDDGIVVTWINNVTADVFSQNANNMVYYSILEGDSWSGANTVTERGSTIVSVDAGTIGGETYIAIVQDVDCDLGTTDDRILKLVDLDGNATQINTDTDMNDGVHFIEMGGVDKLIWYNNSNIYCMDSVTDTPEAMLGDGVIGLPVDYKFIQTGTDSYAIIYTQNDAYDGSDSETLYGSSIYGIFYNDGEWGDVIPVVQNESGYYVDAYDVCMCGGKLLVPYINALVEVTKTDVDKTCTFISTTFTPTDDLVVGEATVIPEGLFEGEGIEIYVPLTNNSWQSLDGVSYEVRDSLGNVIYSGASDICIGSGITDYLEFTLPKSLLSYGESYSVYVSANNYSDSDEDNNMVGLPLWCTDFSVVASEVSLVGRHEIQYTVFNEGNIAGNATLKVYKLTEDGTQILITEIEIPELYAGRSHSGALTITDDYYLDGEDTASIVLSVEYEGEEVYLFNDTTGLSIGSVDYDITTDADTSRPVVESPVADEAYVIYDKASGTSLEFNVIENGWIFGGVDGLSADSYTYTDGALTIDSKYLMTLAEGRYAFTILFSNSSLTTEVSCIVEIRDTSYDSVTITAENLEIKCDGYALVLGKDILYSTQSAGEVSAEYSTDNGATWHDGLPTGVGRYLVRINVAQDDVNKYLPASCVIEVTITKGTRAISAPSVLGMGDMQILFGDAIPTMGKNDGSILYGYSLVNDINTVTEWSSNGVLPITSGSTTYYVFAKIVGGYDFDDAYSVGFAIKTDAHYYSTQWTVDLAPTCTESGIKSHHCVLCGDRRDIVTVAPLGHDYELSFVESEHPHMAHNVCSRCSDTMQEETFSLSCTACVFTHQDIDSATCEITGYIGNSTELVMPADILGKTVVNTSDGAFMNITDITSVKIEPGVQGIGSMAFMGCTSLSKVVIPESVTSIGAKAFFNCADDFMIYCYRDTCAMEYAIDNSHNYYIMDIGEVDGTYIDYENEVILTTREALSNIEDMVYVPMTSLAVVEASMINGNHEFIGTGSIVLVFDDDDFSSEYTIIVDGDINGDSVCDALDAAQLALVSGGRASLDGVYKTAADSNSDDVVDITDYQAIVNKAVA